MNETSTPIHTKSSSQKRQLSSPEELLNLKKNKFISETETEVGESSLDDSEISDLSIMASTETADKGSVITLKEADLTTIAGILNDTFEPTISEMNKSIVDGVLAGLTSTIQSLQKEKAELKKRVSVLEAKADAAEQYSRRNCLRVAGVKENNSENTDVYVIDMARAIGAEIGLDDIERSHRVGKVKAGTPRDIIVKFVSYRTRRLVYGARTQTKTNGYTGVFINEDLTKARNKLLLKARKMVKAKDLKSAWSSDGTVLVRDLEDEKHRIQSVGDLAVFGTVPLSLLPGETPDTEAGAEPGPAVGFFSAPTPEVHGLSMDH